MKIEYPQIPFATRLIIWHDGHHEFHLHYIHGEQHRLIVYDENGEDIGATYYRGGSQTFTESKEDLLKLAKDGREKEIFIALVEQHEQEDIRFGHIQIFGENVVGYTHDTKDEMWSIPTGFATGDILMNVRMS